MTFNPRNLLAGAPVTAHFQCKTTHGDETVTNQPYTPEDMTRDKAVIDAATCVQYTRDGLNIRDGVLWSNPVAICGMPHLTTAEDIDCLIAARTNFPLALSALEQAWGEVERLKEELADGDYWQVRAKQAISGGRCPVCFATDEAGHASSCEWGKAEAEVERLRGEVLSLRESRRSFDCLAKAFEMRSSGDTRDIKERIAEAGREFDAETKRILGDPQ